MRNYLSTHHKQFKYIIQKLHVDYSVGEHAQLFGEITCSYNTDLLWGLKVVKHVLVGSLEVKDTPACL